jgi:branched-chain amino acid transport system ATP-binding protein
LRANYGEGEVLGGIDLHIADREVVSLLGRNGAGKSTIVKAIMGMVTVEAGVIRLAGRNVTGFRPHQMARLGLGYVPEERRVFPSLTVLENLEIIKGLAGSKPWSLQRIFELFPSLADRKSQMGGQLSGGEQQMLAIARVLRQGARGLLLDEPTEGLAPMVVSTINSVVKALKDSGLTVLLIEQNLPFTLEVADRHYIVSEGRIVYEGPSAALVENTALQQKYLTV